jgi:hypothetical protein
MKVFDAKLKASLKGEGNIRNGYLRTPGKVNLAQNVTNPFQDNLSCNPMWLRFMEMSNNILVKFVTKDCS